MMDILLVIFSTTFYPYLNLPSQHKIIPLKYLKSQLLLGIRKFIQPLLTFKFVDITHMFPIMM